ncbi:hypothetical protein MC7420_1688 [Coleofasciculus chthonoplastes PCC 7420]|uniref:Uncharacterized protein n=1 Tax=Coleofasciculus chthonoplastes PCC 7420 TaxID=118168 RepID=B4VMU1_9CYAN|nr:hypothetical protein MC7420_1688 [Coleofasciculus chthonoplastes PCC 7420]
MLTVVCCLLSIALSSWLTLILSDYLESFVVSDTSAYGTLCATPNLQNWL